MSDPVYTVEINGVEHDVLLDGFQWNDIARGIPTLACGIDSEDASLRIALDTDVKFKVDGTARLGGLATHVQESAQAGEAIAAIINGVEATGYRELLRRRLVKGTISAGTLKAALTALLALIPSAGITLDAAQANGPTLPEFTFDYQRGDDALTQIVTAAGGDWFDRISPTKVLRVYQAGDLSAPFNVNNTTLNAGYLDGDVTVDQERDPNTYANRIVLRAGQGTAMKTATFTADGVATSWVLPFDVEASFLPGVINFGTMPVFIVGSNGANNPVPLGSYERDWVVAPTFFLLYLRNSDHTLYQRAGDPPFPNGTVFSVDYNAQFPYTVISEDTGEQAPPTGIVERMVAAPNVTDADMAQALADAELAIALFTPKVVTYGTYQPGLEAGQRQSLVISERGINGTFLINEVRASADLDRLQLRYVVTATESSSILPGYRAVIEQWAQTGSSTQAGATSGSSAPSVPSIPSSVTSSVLSRTTRLDNNQIKGLESALVELVPAPGVNKRLQLLWADFVGHIAVDYSNIHPDADWEISLDGTNFGYGMKIANDSAIGFGLLTDFLTGGPRYTRTWVMQNLSPMPVGDYGLLPSVRDGLETNMALCLNANNQGAGPLTGGNAANYVQVTTFYVVVETP